MKIGFLVISPKSQKLTLGPLSPNPKFKQKPDYPFTIEPGYTIGFEI